MATPSTIDTHASAILRVCSYHRRDFDLVLICSSPHDMQAVQNSLQTAFSTPPMSGLGIMDRLPGELMSIVLGNLDLLSYFHFRQVNRRARVLSTWHREYGLIAKHGLEALRSLLRTNLASCFTILELYFRLTSPNCSLCGSFGGCIFLFTITRCCFDCIQESPNLRVLSTSAFAKLAHTSTRRLHQLTKLTLRTVPGIYSMMQQPVKRPKHLVAERQAAAVLRSLGTCPQSLEEALARRSDQPRLRFMACTAFPWYNLDHARIEPGVSCKGCQVRVETSSGEYKARDQVYSTTGFLAHFEYCEESQHLWAESQQATMTAAEPELTRQGG